MTYAEECRLLAQMLLDAADGVEFQFKNPLGQWNDAGETTFHLHIDRYRRKPKKVRHERVVVWYQDDKGHVMLCMYTPSTIPCMPAVYKELKRETVFVEVEG